MASVCGIIVLAFPISMIIDKFAESTGCWNGDDDRDPPKRSKSKRAFFWPAQSNSESQYSYELIRPLEWSDMSRRRIRSSDDGFQCSIELVGAYRPTGRVMSTTVLKRWVFIMIIVADRSCCFFSFNVSEASKRCSLDTYCQLKRGSIYFLRSSVVGAPEESRFLELHSHYQLCRLPNLLLTLYLVYLWRMVYIFVICHWCIVYVRACVTSDSICRKRRSLMVPISNP